MSDGFTEAWKNLTLDKPKNNNMTENRVELFKEIELERAYQDNKWGDEFDKKNTINDWASYINIYLGRACEMGRPKNQQRENLIKVAALAIAALERFDENLGFAPRHYDDK
jgi:hypothetical protein